jgi:PKD repeat protein
VQFRLAGDPANVGRFVDMRSNAAGQVSFKYGTFPVTNGAYGSAMTVSGDADAGSTYNANGTITIVISRSKIGNPAVGSALQGFLMRVRIDPAGITPDNMPDSLAPDGSYTVVGNEFCRPNNAPIARLTASPTKGTAPITVTFNGSGSSDPDGDAITSYTFSFGDGTPDVTQSSPTILHTYSYRGPYQGRLRVKDARGMTSANAATVMLDIKGKKRP